MLVAARRFRAEARRRGDGARRLLTELGLGGSRGGADVRSWCSAVAQGACARRLLTESTENTERNNLEKNDFKKNVLKILPPYASVLSVLSVSNSKGNGREQEGDGSPRLRVSA